MLKQIFIELSLKYSGNTRLIETLWTEIEKNYAHKTRHYHTLAHLENLYVQLEEAKKEIEDWDTVLFTLFYHDIIYNPVNNDNEAKSAELAKRRVQSLAYPTNKIDKCVKQILATKEHIKSTNSDTNFFTDADLSILGQAWEKYADYLNQVRKEYSVYPDFIYNPGRKKVLNSFLNRERVFKTNLFFEKFEKTARQNMVKELEQL